ncbi:hypothetical protein C0J52_01648 [Blattella germanica]|nr:hypothetical protein C0J52_01648 [Blattella germanica]
MRSSVSVILSSPAPDTSMSHPDYEQTAHDHAAILLLVKHVGSQLKQKNFSRVYDRLSRVNHVKVVDSMGVTREVLARYIKEYPVENNDWGDYQTHRRLLGLISVGEHIFSKYDGQQELNELCRVHESLKVKYSSTLFDSRSVLFGPPADTSPTEPNVLSTPSNFKTRALFYEDCEACAGLEEQISEFLSSLFWVLESKRLERSREKVERVSLLLAPFERKDFVGLDLESRSNRKRCVGRMTKHLGDLSLQAGLAAEALSYYNSAVDILKAVNDWLWLGGAFEGLCAASVILLYPNLSRSFPLQRNASLQEGSPGKQRTNSFSTNSLPSGLSPAEVQQEVQNVLSPEEIPKRYREAIIHYSKIQRFTSLSDLYTQIGFHRKASFCRRLAATRHVSAQNPQPNWSQYGLQGWPALQIQLLQELVVAARRMGHSALATRHMTFLLQTMWDHLQPAEQRDLAMQLQVLAAQCEGAPVALVLNSGVVIPPANLTNLPQISMPSSLSLPPDSGPHPVILSGTPKELGELEVLDASSTAYGSQPVSFLSGPSSLPSRLSSPTFGREQGSRRSELTSSFRSGTSSRSGSSLGSSRSPFSKLGAPNNSKLKLRYSGGAGLEAGYCRVSSVTLCVEMLPSVQITNWDVLPAETNSQFYLVLDIANSTSHEIELQYTPSKNILIEGNESCRIPVPINRCPLSKLTKLYRGEKITADDRLELDLICSEHIASSVDLRWHILSSDTRGKVSLKGIILTPEMLDLVRMSPLQWEVTLNEQPVKPQEELSCHAGQCLKLGVSVHNFLERSLRFVCLTVRFYQDHQNGLEEQGSAYHECCIVFFTPGQYKVDIQCSSNDNDPTSEKDQSLNEVGHTWKFTPPVAITVAED